MKYYLLSFIFGVITYPYIPKDAIVPNPTVASRNTRIFVSDENQCAVYQEPYNLGKNLQPIIDVVCNK